MKISEARHGMRVIGSSFQGEGTIVQIHFGAVEVDCDDGGRVAVAQNDHGYLLLREVPPETK